MPPRSPEAPLGGEKFGNARLFNLANANRDMPGQNTAVQPRYSSKRLEDLTPTKLRIP